MRQGWIQRALATHVRTHANTQMPYIVMAYVVMATGAPIPVTPSSLVAKSDPSATAPGRYSNGAPSTQQACQYAHAIGLRCGHNYIATAYIVMAHVVMASRVMAHLIMAGVHTRRVPVCVMCAVCRHDVLRDVCNTTVALFRWAPCAARSPMP